MKGMIKDGASLDTVMLALNDNFGGAAAKSASTAAGQFKILKNSLAETQESIGAGLLPVLQKVLPYLQSMADWAQKNPKAFLIVAGTISAIATAILAVNFAMAANPFTLIAIGIAALVTGLAVAYTKFETFRNGVNFVINGLIAGFELMANSFIGAINLIIRGMNLINPFTDIDPLSTINLGRIGGGGGATSGGQAREGGTGSITPALPSMPSLPPAIIGGGSSAGSGKSGSGGVRNGIGAGGDLMTIMNSDAIYAGIGQQMMAVYGKTEGITINVTGGVSTSAEIGQSVYNALLQYKQVYGPLTAIAT